MSKPQKLEQLQELIKTYHDKIRLPVSDPNISKRKIRKYRRNDDQKPNTHKSLLYKSYRINLFPTTDQKKRLLLTMECATTMYNETVNSLNFLKNDFPEHYHHALTHPKTAFRFIRDEYMDELRDELAEKHKVDVNVLDAAIKHAVTSFKSAQTNLNNGSIDKFEVKLLEQNRRYRIIEIDRNRFNSKKVVKSIFGEEEIKCELEGKVPFQTGLINASSIIRYDALTDEFQIIVNQQINKKYTDKTANMSEELKTKVTEVLELPVSKKRAKSAKFLQDKYNGLKMELVPSTVAKPKYDFCALDPGLKTFMTGLTNSTDEFYGEETYDRIVKILGNAFGKLKNNNKQPLEMKYTKSSPKNKKKRKRRKFTKKKKKKFRRRINKRVKNIVKDLHCKTAKKITDECKEVIIGDMSSKSLAQNDGRGSVSKTAMLMMRFYEFRQRLKQQCELKGRLYICVDESYTSKTCSVCGSYNKDLTTSDRVYDCKNCKISIDRDLNACRNIWMKSMNKTNFKLV